MAAIFEKKYTAFFSVYPEGELSGPYLTSEEAQEDVTSHGAVDVRQAATTLQVERLPEGVEDVCQFTGKPPTITLSVFSDEEGHDLSMCEEVARELHEALGKLLG